MPRPLPDALFETGDWQVRAEGLASMLPAPRVMDAAELRALDAAAVDSLGLPSALLMENAALHASSLVARLCSLDAGALIVAGAGNNGGDGLALARLLLARGVPARAVLLGDPNRLSPDASLNRAALPPDTVAATPEARDGEPGLLGTLAAEINAARPAVIVDALFGTGLSRPIVGPAAGAVAAINEAGSGRDGPWVVSLDLPSGLDADRGVPLGPCVRADLTITFAALKRGFAAVEAQPVLGQLALVPIGVPSAFVSGFGEPLGLDPVGNWRTDSGGGARAAPSPGGAGRDARR